MGVLSGILILENFNILQSLKHFVLLFAQLLSTPWILKTLAFALLVGSVMALIRRSGGLEAFIRYVSEKEGLIRSERSALLLVYVIGVLIFIESSITSLVSGAIGQPLADKYGFSRAKLAYVCDATSASVCSIILFNGWGALLVGLIVAQIELGVIEGDAVAWLLKSIPYNFYAFSALLIAFVVIWFQIGFKTHTAPKTVSLVSAQKSDAKIGYMIWPIVWMVGFVFVFLYITGDGNLLKGSGSSSIFYTLIVTLLLILLYYLKAGIIDVKTWAVESFLGAKSMFSIMLILLFAFAIGQVTHDLHTGLYLAGYSKEVLDPHYIAAAVFLLAALMAFATGTSWGTFSIMMPIAVPLAAGMDANIALAMGAVISGGVFGDHCSPISDTTVISSMAAGCDHIEHVKTQLPYALLGGLISLGLFTALG